MTDHRAVFERDSEAYNAMLDTLRSACERNQIPTSDLDLLSSNTMSAQAIADHLMKQLRQCAELNRGMSEPLPPGHYVLTVNRDGWPSTEQIQKDFRYYSCFETSKPRVWQPHPTRALSSVARARTVVGYVKQVRRKTAIELVIQEQLERGWTLGNHEELYALAASAHAAHLHYGESITAPGSSFLDGQRRCVAVIRWLEASNGPSPSGYGLTDTNFPVEAARDELILFVKPYEPATLVRETLPIIEVPAVLTDELLDQLFRQHQIFRSELVVLAEDHVEAEQNLRFEAKLFKPTEGISIKEARAHLAKDGFVGNTRAFAEWCRQNGDQKGNFVSLPEVANLRHARSRNGGYLTFVTTAQPTPHPSFITANAEIMRGWTFVGFREISP